MSDDPENALKVQSRVSDGPENALKVQSRVSDDPENALKVQPIQSVDQPKFHLRGVPWRPGQSGNPAGRPKTFAGMVKERTKQGEEIIDVMIDLMRTGRDSVRLEAAKELANRLWGRPVETQVQIDARQSSEVGQLPGGALEALARALTAGASVTVTQKAETIDGTITRTEAVNPRKD